MALGFGFNKAKVLASAEKFVQQGKLPNAISEYEKIIKEDPKDVTVLNTIGDLYARVGQNDRAATYFKKVADQYAQSGFTVKAIAVYKKLVKLQPTTSDVTLKLAELYTQQGLFNDARAQYMHLADGFLKSGDNNQAARVLQRILELDPENASTQARLADLYLKIGKKEQAQKIFQNATEALYAKGAYDAAKEALNKLLKLDPSNGDAMRLRGMIAAQKGDSHSAIEYLEQAPDLDSRPEGLRALLRARLDSSNAEGAESIANKLLNLHKDPNGTTSLVEWYIEKGQPEKALRLYEQNADRLLAAGSTAARDAVAPVAAQMDPEALKTMRALANAGDSSQTAEMMETQAHDFAQKGAFAQARDLYKKLSELEPENALHLQNYRQMLVKLGEDPAARILSPEEAAQAFMVEELDSGSPVVQQKYDPPTESAIEAALTDAELFVSYNVPSKAIPPLEAALPLAPQDITLNQRLASLYARAERWSDAARMCQNLSDIYRELGHPSESARYQEAAKKYGLRSPGGVAPAPARQPLAQPATPSVIPVAPEPVASAPATAPAEEHSVQEFSFDVRDQLVSEESGESGAAAIPVEIMPAMPVEIPVEKTEEEVPAPAAQKAEEIDLSGEWESMLTVEEEASAPAAANPPELEVVPQKKKPSAMKAEPEGGTAPAEKVQEVQFYISQQMWEPARRTLRELQEIAPEAPEISELMAAVSAGGSKRTEPKPAESFASSGMEPSTVDFLPPPFAAPAPQAPRQAPPEQKAAPKVAAPPAPPPRPVAQPPAQSVASAASEPVREIKSPPPRTAPPAEPPAAAAAVSTEDILGDFIHDLEEKDLADFVPQARPQPGAPAPAAAMNGSSNGEMQDADSASVLSDILTDLQEETAAAGAGGEGEEDPETHYNLGIAFKEMGLLDEAIGELQKVCRAVDRGHRFSQPIQAYTWLAQCLVDKGAPEAAVRWYQKALKLPGMDDSSRLAVYYDLAAAYEASGDRKAALANFMEVYGSNIDFRDVAGRIKALKS